MTEQIRCDGETLFGFMVKACDQEATYFPCNTPNECYQFCARHFYFYEHGRYPDEPIADETGPNAISSIDYGDADQQVGLDEGKA
jgi:hypothetical protein